MTPQELLDKLLDQGATVEQLNSLGLDFVVGVCEIVGEGKAVLMPVFPQGTQDVHVVEFDRIEIPHDLGLFFFVDGGRNSLYITTIDESVYDDNKKAEAKEVFSKWKEKKEDFDVFIRHEIKLHKSK